MYLNGCCGLGLVRSLDYGQIWIQKIPHLSTIPYHFVRRGHPNGSTWASMKVIPRRIVQIHRSGDTWAQVSSTSGVAGNFPSLLTRPSRPEHRYRYLDRASVYLRRWRHLERPGHSCQPGRPVVLCAHPVWHGGKRSCSPFPATIRRII